MSHILIIYMLPTKSDQELSKYDLRLELEIFYQLLLLKTSYLRRVKKKGLVGKTCTSINPLTQMVILEWPFVLMCINGGGPPKLSTSLIH